MFNKRNCFFFSFCFFFVLLLFLSKMNIFHTDWFPLVFPFWNDFVIVFISTPRLIISVEIQNTDFLYLKKNRFSFLNSFILVSKNFYDLNENSLSIITFVFFKYSGLCQMWVQQKATFFLLTFNMFKNNACSRVYFMNINSLSHESVLYNFCLLMK